MANAPDSSTRDILVAEFVPMAQEAFTKTGHREVWGVEFPEDQSEWTAKHRAVLCKFVSAKPTVGEALAQLSSTLEWRKTFRPLDAAYKEDHSDMFAPLGVITPTPQGRVVSWNLYGAIKDPANTVFSDLDAFTRWRVGLMERGLAQLDFADPERDTMDQVHDYLNVSFLRMNPEARKGSQKIVQLFQDYYPELLRAKYFVNVPYFMTWVFRIVRMTMDAKTADKFHIVHNGSELAAELGTWVPKVYGGEGDCLQEQAVSGDTSTSKATEKLTADTTPAPALASVAASGPAAADEKASAAAEAANDLAAEPSNAPVGQPAQEPVAETSAAPDAQPMVDSPVLPKLDAPSDSAHGAALEPAPERVREAADAAGQVQTTV